MRNHVRFDVFEPMTEAAVRRTIVFLPGVKSRGDEALLPPDRSTTDPAGVLGALRTLGWVVTATYVREKFFSPKKVVSEIARLIQNELDSGQEVVIIGSSFGGMLAVDALDLVSDDDRRTVRLIPVSTPSGSPDLLGGGDVVGPILKWTRLDWLLTPILALFTDKAGTINAEAIQPDLDTNQVQAEGRVRSSGFSLSGFLRQVGYMSRWRSPRRGWWSFWITYVSCQRDEVVRQPQGANTWAGFCQGFRVREIPVFHCEYLGSPKAFIEAFEAIINE